MILDQVTTISPKKGEGNHNLKMDFVVRSLINEGLEDGELSYNIARDVVVALECVHRWHLVCDTFQARVEVMMRMMVRAHQNGVDVSDLAVIISEDLVHDLIMDLDRADEEDYPDANDDGDEEVWTWAFPKFYASVA